MLTSAQVAGYREDGYLLLPGLFDEEEMRILREVSRRDPALREHAVERDDGEGGKSRITLWNDAGDDLFGLVARCQRMVDTALRLVGEEVYHWHSKMMQKEPFSGGAWIWHQDYGYWYMDTCLYPLLTSCYIAIDPATRENGCLQVLRGSHHMGRIDHVRVGGQVGADPDRVKLAEQRMELVYCEMSPGDALFFHCNLLHRSDANRSPNPRWGLICCYNARRNSPLVQRGHPQYTPLRTVPDSALREACHTFLEDSHSFMA